MARHGRHKKTVYLLTITLFMVVSLFAVLDSTSTNSEFNSTNDNNESNKPDTKIIEGAPLFAPAADVDDYIDAAHSITTGTHSTVPPSGMGANNVIYTALTEADVGTTTLLQQTDFSSKPSGWTDDGNVVYSSSGFSSSSMVSSGYLYCATVDTQFFNEVIFKLDTYLHDMFGSGGSISITISFYNKFGAWVDLETVHNEYDGDVTVSSSSPDYLHSNFRVRVSYDSTGFEMAFTGNNWRIIANIGVSGAFDALVD